MGALDRIEALDERLDHAANLYLDLLIRSMTRVTTGGGYRRLLPRTRARAAVFKPVDRLLAQAGLALVKAEADEQRRIEGVSFIDADADASSGVRRLQFLARQLVALHSDGVPGDLVELGCWRGGGAILMRGFLAAVGDRGRRVWAADSFRGYPAPTASTAGAFDHVLAANSVFVVSLEEVRTRFARYGLLDEQVQFLDGFFADTLPGAPIEQIALVHIDVSTYDGTRDALLHTFDKVAPGGIVFFGDVGADGSRRAVEDFKAERALDLELQDVPQEHKLGAFWRLASAG